MKLLVGKINGSELCDCLDLRSVLRAPLMWNFEG